MRILLASDFGLIRDGIRGILARRFQPATAGEAQSAAQLMDTIGHSAWDLLLLDEHLPEGHCVELLERIRQRAPALPILLMNFRSEYPFVMQVIQAGIKGYVSKHDVLEQLPYAVGKVLAGGRYFSPDIAELLVSATDSNVNGQSLHAKLSERERSIMLMLSQGKTPKHIAYDLNLSIKTISTYRGRALRKLNMKSNAEFIGYAIKNNLIQSRF